MSLKTREESRTAEGAAPEGQVSPGAQIIATGQRAASLSDYYRETLATIGDAFSSPYAVLYVRLASEVIEHSRHSGPTAPQFWKPVVDPFLTESLATPKPRARMLTTPDARLSLGVMCVPLANARGQRIGALAVVAPLTPQTAPGQVALLEALAALTGAAAPGTGSGASGEVTFGGPPPTQMLAKGAAAESVEEFAFAITNGLRNKLNCDQVALGLVRGAGIRLLSISGLDDIKARSPGVQDIRGAMEECLDAAQPIVINRSGAAERSDAAYVLHRQWHEAGRGAAVASIPLRIEEQVVAVLSVRRSGDDPLTDTTIEQLIKATEPCGRALELVRVARRGVVGHVRDAAVARVAAIIQPGAWGRKLLLIGGLAFAAWLCFGRMEYRVTAHATVAPAEMRHITMPFDGVLQTATVVAGDAVGAGQILGTLDDGALRIEQAELEAQRQLAESEMTAALAEGRSVDAQLALARQKVSQARLASVNRRIDQCVLRSPYSGVVVTGDLSTRIGAVLPQGEELFAVAPLDAFTLEVAVPEHAATDIKPGMRGRFISEARPEDEHEIAVVRVAPSSEHQADRNVFVGKSVLAAPQAWLRPGMEGVARIDAGPRPVWWIALHRVIDAARVHLWL